MTSSCCSVGHRGPELFPEAQYSSHTDSDMCTRWSAPVTLSVRVLPSVLWGPGARRSRRRWAAAAGCHGRQECGKRASEGGHDCFSSSIIVTGFAPLSLMVASLSGTKTSCQTHKTNHFRCGEQTKRGEKPPSPPRGGPGRAHVSASSSKKNKCE